MTVEILTLIGANGTAFTAFIWWAKTYIESKVKTIEKNTERIASLETSVKYKEEKLSSITDKLEILVDGINQTNLKMMELQTLMEVYLKKQG